MNTAAKEEMPQGSRERRRLRRERSRRVWDVVVVAIMVAGIAALIFVFYQRYTFGGEYRLEYEGRVVEKSLTVIESRYGSGQALRLRIRQKDGQEFQVAVNRGLYDRAQEGMWIKRSREGVKLSWEELEP